MNDKNNLPDTAEEAAAKWAHPALLKIWVIIMMPDYEDGEPVLHRKEIGEIGAAVLELNKDFNKSEVKRLYRHLKGMV